MRRVAPLALAVLLLAVPMVDAAATGARTPLDVPCPTTGNCAVQDVDIGASTSAQCSTSVSPAPSGAPCRFVAGTLDPTGLLTGGASAASWNVWNLDGSTRASGGADATICPSPPPGTFGEDCDSDVIEVAISASGNRIAVASRRDTMHDLVQVFSDTGSRLSYHELDENVVINDLAIDESGNRVAVGALFRDTANPQDTQDGRVLLLSASADTELFDYTSEDPVTTVDLSDEVLAAGAGGRHMRFIVPSPTDFANTAITGTVTDVDVAADHAADWSVAGYNSGFFAVYSDEQGSGQQPSVPEYQKREGGETSAVNAVAIRNDGTQFAVAHEGGRLRLYRLDPASAPDADVTLHVTKDALGSIDDLAYSADGRYLALLSGDNVRLFFTGNNALDEMWTDTRAGAGAVGTVAIDGRGEHVVAGAGETIVVYDAIHKLTVTVGTATQLAGSDHTYQVQYKNDGNRAESVTLTASPPTGVQTTLTPGEFTLLPGATRTVDVTVDIPGTWTPGTLRVPLHASLNGGSDGVPITNLDISVPTTHDLVLEGDGPTSIGAQGGAPAIFDLRARNEGNVVEDVTLRVTGLAGGWTAEITPLDLVLQPGQSMDVSVSLQPPAGLANGARIDVTLTHDGVAPKPLGLTATVGAVFNMKITTPVGTIVNPGVTSLVNLTVRNDGNTRDSAVVSLSALPTGWLGGFINGQSEMDVQDLEPCQSDPGSCSRVVQMTLRAPEDHSSSVPVQITVVATSVGDDTKVSTGRLLVTVQAAQTGDTETDDDGGNGAPGPAPVLLMVVLALAAFAARRRTR